jgi:hypothetical protein
VHATEEEQPISIHERKVIGLLIHQERVSQPSSIPNPTKSEAQGYEITDSLSSLYLFPGD